MVVYPKQFETILNFKQHNNFARVLGRCYFTGLNVYITSLYLDLNQGPPTNPVLHTYGRLITYGRILKQLMVQDIGKVVVVIMT